MKKPIALVAAVLVLALALTAAAMPLGQGDGQDQAAFPGERSIEVRGEGSHATFGGNLQEPGVTSFSAAITAEGADAVFGAPLQVP